MAAQAGFFDAEDRLRALSAAGDPLERLNAVVDFELFRAELEAALRRCDRSRGGRPAYDAVLMLRVLVLQTLYTLSDDAAEFQIKDRLSFMRFLGLGLHERVPDAKTIWLFREQLTRAGAIRELFASFDAHLKARGHLAMSGQIVDAFDHCRASTAEHRSREDGDQGRPNPRGLGCTAEQAGAKGSRREVDAEARQGETSERGRHHKASGRDRHPGVRLQEPRLD